MTRLSPEEHRLIARAVVNLEAAIEQMPGFFRTGHDHEEIVGDALEVALAMKGFVIVYDPAGAAEVAALAERGGGAPVS